MPLEELIATGGDERIRIKDDGLNKYFVHPCHYKGVLNRGSCTVNLLTEETEKVARDTLHNIQEVGFESVRRQQAKELKELINFGEDDRFEIFFAPSGSDLCYLPLMLARLIHPSKNICNIITCPEELGSGSLTASSGKYFFSVNQFGEKVEKGGDIESGFPINVKTFPARDTDGSIIDHRLNILKEIQNNYQEYTVIGNLVIGSKSGIYDNINIIPSAPADMLWVVDMCQFRTARSLVHELIDLNAMVMITGSKFYQAPPFCGALLVPRNIIARIHNISQKVIQPFTTIFSKYDIPESLPKLRNHFRDYENIGLLLRWQAALHEMGLMTEYKSYALLSGISKWNDFIVTSISNLPEYFELMPDQDLTNKTIISFRLKHRAGDFLVDSELREVYRTIILSTHKELNGYNKVIIGQPVKYAERSFLRLALGAHDLHKLFESDFDLTNDERIIHIIINTLKEIYW